jgi:cell wall-associated NlpC family hydrolase
MKTWLAGIFFFGIGLFTIIFGNDNPIRGVITGTMVNLRESASFTAKVLTVMAQGSMVVVEGKQGEWVQVKLGDGLEGWVYQQYITTDPGTVESRERFFAKTGKIASLALRYLGFKYRYGGASPRGFDCSGFTMYIYSQFGWKLPHNAAAQMELGMTVKKEDLLPGDLVFFRTLNSYKINHVGIYLGEGDFIHAASGSGLITVSNMNNGYYKYKFYSARRLG